MIFQEVGETRIYRRESSLQSPRVRRKPNNVQLKIGNPERGRTLVIRVIAVLTVCYV